MRRFLERYLVSEISRMLVAGEIPDKSHVECSSDGKQFKFVVQERNDQQREAKRPKIEEVE